MSIKTILKNLAVEPKQKGCSTGGQWMGSGSEIAAVSPVDGSLLGNVQTATVEDYENLIERAEPMCNTSNMLKAEPILNIPYTDKGI